MYLLVIKAFVKSCDVVASASRDLMTWQVYLGQDR